MILVLKENVGKHHVDKLIARLTWMQLTAVAIENDRHYSIAIVNGVNAYTRAEQFAKLPGVATVLPFENKLRLTCRQIRSKASEITIGGVTIGGGTLTVMAGPCAIESEQQIHTTAQYVARAGAQILRGGAFKPRTSPYEFQGLGELGLQHMQSAARENNLLSVSEVMDTQEVELVAKYVDILQIGARNMQNYSLLKLVGKMGKPVLLKRGMSATYMDLLMAAEYIMQSGNEQVILCERGIRTFETHARNTLDIAAAPILQELSHLPVIIDPSHGTGIRSIVPKLALAAVAAGADGVMIEVHPDPDRSISDAKQTIYPQVFCDLIPRLRSVHQITKMPIISEVQDGFCYSA